MRESELKLERALDSAVLIHDIRAILNSATEGRAEWVPEVGSLINQIDDILTHTPNAHVPTEWRVIVAGLRVLASQVACVTIAQDGQGDLIAERVKCDVLVGVCQKTSQLSESKWCVPIFEWRRFIIFGRIKVILTVYRLI